MRRLLSITLLSVFALSISAQSDSIRMDSVVHELPDVMVKGGRPLAHINGSTITYDLPQIISGRQVENVYDALKLLPGVVERDGVLTLGMQSATVILNGKVTTLSLEELTSMLKSMPASRVEKVEVMYNAPAKMQVHGAVINVRLRQRNDDNAPLQGEANLAWNQNHDANYGERGTLLYNRGTLSVDAMYLHSHGTSYRTIDDFSHQHLNDGTTHDITMYGHDRSKNHSDTWRIGLDYRFAKDHTLSFAYNGIYNHDNVDSWQTGNIAGNALTRSHSLLQNLRADYELPFGLTASAEMTFYETPEHQTLASTMPTGSLRYEVENRQRVNRWKFSLAEEHSLGKAWHVNYGVVYTTSINHGSQTYSDINTPNSTPGNSLTRQREDDVNLYAGFNTNFSARLMLEASVAMEYYHSPSWKKWTAYPTMNLTFLPSPGHVMQLGLNYSRNYPDYWSMSPYTSYGAGGYNEIVGNPKLRPSDTYKLQLVYMLKSRYQAVVYVRHTSNAFYQTPYQRHDRLTVAYQVLNFNNDDQVGMQLAAPFSIGSWLNSNATAVAFCMRQKDDDFYDIPFDRKRLVGVFILNNNFTLSHRHDLTANLDLTSQTKAIQATYDIPGLWRMDAGMRWQFWNRTGILHVFCNDIFRTYRTDPRISYMGQDLTMKMSCYRQFGVSFTYKFGGYKERHHEAVDTSRFK